MNTKVKITGIVIATIITFIVFGAIVKGNFKVAEDIQHQIAPDESCVTERDIFGNCIQKESSDVVIDLSSKQWEFTPSEIQVKQGQSVTLKITSTDVSHGFALEEYNIYAFVTPGETVEITFIANNVGIFEFFCNVFCGEGHSKHRGNLIVK